MIKDLINTATFKIDSFSCAIPINLVDIYKDKVYIVEKSTGAILEEKNKQYKHELFEGTASLNLLFKSYFGVEHLVLSINSKQLGKKYFSGIDKENFFYILNLYEKTFNFKLLNYNIENFIFSDVDIFADFDISFNKYFEDYLLFVKKNLIPYSRVFYSSNTFDNIRSIKGLQVNNRNDSSANHFFKFYNKKIEIEENELTNKFIYLNNLPYLNKGFRFEFTLRNSYSRKFFGINSTTDFFTANYNDIAIKLLTKLNFFTPIENINLSKNRTLKQLSINQYIIIKLFLNELQNGKSFNQIFKSLNLSDLASDQSKSRKRTEIRNILITILKESKTPFKTLKKDFWLG